MKPTFDLFFKNAQNIFCVSHPANSEDLIELELQKVGIEKSYRLKGSVYFECRWTEVLTFCLSTSVASRVSIVSSYFNFNSLEEYKDQVYLASNRTPFKTPFETYKIHTTLSGDIKRLPLFKSPLFFSQLLKDVVQENFKNPVDTQNPNWVLDQKIIKDPITQTYKSFILLDLTSDPLSHRGYRLPGHNSPLRENMAGLLAFRMLQQKAGTIMDLMAGTGTVPLEYFFIFHQLSPQIVHLINNPTEWLKALSFPFLSAAIKRDLVEIMNQKKDEFLNFTGEKMGANDVDFIHLTKTQKLFESFHRCPYKISTKDIFSIKEKDLKNYDSLFLNPPYGIRLERDPQFIEKILTHLKSEAAGKTLYLLLPQIEESHAFPLRWDKRWRVKNGPIDCDFLKIELFSLNPAG